MKNIKPKHVNYDTKTVLYVGGFELPDKNAAAQRVISNAKILRTLGYEVVFISIDKTLNSKVPILNTKSSFEGFTFYNIKYPVSLSEWLIYLTSIKKIIDLKFLNSSILIAYNYPAIALLKLKMYCNKSNIRIIADCTEWYEAQGNAVHKLIKSFDVFLRMHIVHPKLNGLIVISEFLSNFYKSKNENTLQLPPLVDLSMDKWKILNDVNEENKIRLIYAGSPGGGKKDRIDEIIRILSKIKKTTNIQFNFVIVGLTKAEYIELFKNEILPQNIDEFVFFKGRLTHTETLKEIFNADFQIFLRDKNLTNMAGFPTKYVESISCGTPVLTNSSSNIKDYFISGKTGFMLDVTSEKLFEMDLINALSLGRKSIKQMSEFCKSSFMFDYKNYINSFEVFLKKVVEKATL